ncbi:MAG: hypothetical protein AAFQ41_03835, partial [Cyanobacteria bacterium J06623_7]
MKINSQTRSHFVLLILLLSMALVSCSGGGSSNSDSSDTDSSPTPETPVNSEAECSDDFGDASRCDVRQGL